VPCAGNVSAIVIVKTGAAKLLAVPTPSVATSPAVLAAPTDALRLLTGPDGSQPALTTLSPRLADPRGWGQPGLGHPEWGPIKVTTTDPGSTPLGTGMLLALVGVQTQTPTPDVGAAAFRRADVQQALLGHISSVVESNKRLEDDLTYSRFRMEEQAQEIVDDFVIKLRIVRFLRTPEYDDLFAGDPTWVTESIGGMGDDGRALVTKTSYRFLHTLYNLGPAPEPNLTIWYSPRLPDGFRDFVAKVAIETSSIQFESDEIMRREWGDDGAIACCVSPMLVGKQMQFFGARANLAKCLLYAINGGRDELTGEQVGPAIGAVRGEFLDFDDVIGKFEKMMDWLAGVYVNAMNIIHYMHDKYAYERLEMALHDYAPMRTMAFGMAGMSVIADSLSAIRYAKVRVVRNDNGLITDYQTTGEFPQFGNNDNKVDQLASWVVTTFMNKLRKYPTYRHALHTQSVLTITSNVVYGKNTGNTPDGRRKGEPFAPGAKIDTIDFPELDVHSALTDASATHAGKVRLASNSSAES